MITSSSEQVIVHCINIDHFESRINIRVPEKYLNQLNHVVQLVLPAYNLSLNCFCGGGGGREGVITLFPLFVKWAEKKIKRF